MIKTLDEKIAELQERNKKEELTCEICSDIAIYRNHDIEDELRKGRKILCPSCHMDMYPMAMDFMILGYRLFQYLCILGSCPVGYIPRFP